MRIWYQQAKSIIHFYIKWSLKYFRFTVNIMILHKLWSIFKSDKKLILIDLQMAKRSNSTGKRKLS